MRAIWPAHLNFLQYGEDEKKGTEEKNEKMNDK
jgi:hypothetical protein